MGLYDTIDIAVSASGDITLGSNADFQLTPASGVLKQDIAFRLRTNFNEFVPHPKIGANLDELIGEPNTRETVDVGHVKITNSLTFDRMVLPADLYVRGVPISQSQVVYYVFVNNGLEQLNVTPDVVFDMMEGLVNIPGE